MKSLFARVRFCFEPSNIILRQNIRLFSSTSNVCNNGTKSQFDKSYAYDAHKTRSLLNQDFNNPINPTDSFNVKPVAALDDYHINRVEGDLTVAQQYQDQSIDLSKVVSADFNLDIKDNGSIEQGASLSNSIGTTINNHKIHVSHNSSYSESLTFGNDGSIEQNKSSTQKIACQLPTKSKVCEDKIYAKRKEYEKRKQDSDGSSEYNAGIEHFAGIKKKIGGDNCNASGAIEVSKISNTTIKNDGKLLYDTTTTTKTEKIAARGEARVTIKQEDVASSSFTAAIHSKSTTTTSESGILVNTNTTVENNKLCGITYKNNVTQTATPSEHLQAALIAGTAEVAKGIRNGNLDGGTVAKTAARASTTSIGSKMVQQATKCPATTSTIVGAAASTVQNFDGLTSGDAKRQNEAIGNIATDTAKSAAVGVATKCIKLPGAGAVAGDVLFNYGPNMIDALNKGDTNRAVEETVKFSARSSFVAVGAAVGGPVGAVVGGIIGSFFT